MLITSAVVRKSPRERGFVLLLHSVMVMFTVAMVGLAIDAGLLYLVKGRLSSAVDAAALAAGRSLNLGNTVSEANTAATSVAGQFFTANFPNNYLGTGTVPTPTVTFTQETDDNNNVTGVLDIGVTATVPAPTYFMRIFNISSVNVKSTGTAQRRGLVMMIVLDISTSMNTSPAPSACQTMVTATQNFITLFSPYDTIGVVTFDYTAHLLYSPSTNFNDGTLNGLIGGINCHDNTNTVSGLELAWRQIQAVNLPLADNTIVLFTDGSPNGISAQFPIRQTVDTRWGPAASSPAPPSQSGALYDGFSNSCTSGNNGHNSACVNMPVECTSGGTVTGTITQTSGQDSYGGSTGGLFLPMDGNSAITYPSGCSGSTNSLVRQMVAYIPDTDLYGNNTHGVTAFSNGPTTATIGGHLLVTRDNWLYQVNSQCTPSNSSNCKFIGGLWSANSSIGTGSNYFPIGNPYSGKLRPDQPNTIVAASMNASMAEAYKIRGNLNSLGAAITPNFHVTIDTIYLTGNFGDAVDREFLPIIANIEEIPALPYDPLSYTPYNNPAFVTNQEEGTYLVTADKTKLSALFAQLASEVLRLSR